MLLPYACCVLTLCLGFRLPPTIGRSWLLTKAYGHSKAYSVSALLGVIAGWADAHRLFLPAQNKPCKRRKPFCRRTLPAAQSKRLLCLQRAGRSTNNEQELEKIDPTMDPTVCPLKDYHTSLVHTGFCFQSHFIETTRTPTRVVGLQQPSHGQVLVWRL